jgi:signal transduction histidine kinase
MSNAQHTSQEIHILIVDDKPNNLRLLSRMLLDRAYHIHSATSGAEALVLAQDIFPDLILLDIMMPQMDGYEVCKHLKADPKTRDIPVIFLSALDQTEDKVNAFKVGGIDYITKPFKLQEVIVRVQTHLALRDLRNQLQGANRELEDRLTELAQANAKLQDRNEELDAFAHTVAHDLKNPLGLITGYAELLYIDSDVLDPETLRFHANNIVRGAAKMKSIINNLLLLASARKMDADIGPLDMNQVVEGALERLTDVIEKSQAEIQIPQHWPMALGYAPWIEEVWANYISNALKYGGQPKQGISPAIELGFDESWDKSMDTPADSVPPSSGPQICFWVRDNGGGLTAEEQTQLFTPYVRLDQVRIKGHGLGLSIVRRIVEKLDGEVGVKSKVGEGSKFYFTLPVA